MFHVAEEIEGLAGFVSSPCLAAIESTICDRRAGTNRRSSMIPRQIRSRSLTGSMSAAMAPATSAAILNCASCVVVKLMRISVLGWIAAAVGFAGVLLIARPGGALAPMGVMFALICAAVSVVYILLSRLLAASESTMALLFHVALTGTIVFGLILPFNWQSFVFSR